LISNLLFDGVKPGTRWCQTGHSMVSNRALDGVKPGTRWCQTGHSGVKPGTDGVKPGTDGVKPGTDGVKPGTSIKVRSFPKTYLNLFDIVGSQFLRIVKIGHLLVSGSSFCGLAIVFH